MPVSLFRFIKNTPKNNKIIFGANNVLWNNHVDKAKNLSLTKINGFIYPETRRVLNILQNNNFSLNVVSRSTTSDKCQYFIQNCFRNIKFDNILVYPTKSNKIDHIANCLDNYKEPFVFFDNNMKILENVKNVYPNATVFYINTPVTFNTFKTISYRDQSPYAGLIK